MSKKAWIIFVVVIFGLLTALVIWSRSNSVTIDTSSINTNLIQPASKQNGNIGDHLYGKADSKVIFIEYGDYQCPGCGAADPGLETIRSQYKNDIAFVFRNFPLTSIHQNALAAAAAVEAAGLEGKYWEMHKIVYANQSDWENLSGIDRTNKFVSYAKGLGIDTAKYTSDLSLNSISQKISFDEAIARKVGINSTPTLYLDGTILPTDVLQDVQTSSGDKLRNALDAALKAVGVTPPARGASTTN